MYEDTTNNPNKQTHRSYEKDAKKLAETKTGVRTNHACVHITVHYYGI